MANKRLKNLLEAVCTFQTASFLLASKEFIRHPFKYTTSPQKDMLYPTFRLLLERKDSTNPRSDMMNPKSDMMNPCSDTMNPNSDLINPI